MYNQPHEPGYFPMPGAAAKTLIQAGHMTPQNLGCIELPPLVNLGGVAEGHNC